ncbi:MAG TPA: 3-hydroxyacyl-CoA dehydrogenase NAD-binding domain-containing protein [Dermatophilaceae bacterium]|nr:3-hydroxyacyl-CoA dehydrogenase NAD-binding domain-containing protein [Dermatophilaceae bacterium]
MSAALDPAAVFPDEVVTRSLVRDVDLAGVGTFALITLDNGHDHTRPSTFGPASLRALADAVDRLRARAEDGEIVGVGVTGKPFLFAAGADLKGVAVLTRREQALAVGRLGHATFAAFADLPVPTFAFVNGAALGGGVELPLHAGYRAISSGVRAFGLPETFLGLVPGWGGCYLLPRLVGVEAALQVIVENPLANNRMLSGPQALRLGLVDVMFEPAAFLEDCLAWAAGVIAGRVRVERRAIDLGDRAAWDGVVDAARRAVLERTGGAAPAPLRALELVRAARTSSREQAYAAEDEALADLVMGEELRAGLYAFDLLQRRARRPAGAPDASLARPVTKVGIVGAGLMASQLAWLFLRRLEVPVVLTDVDARRIATAVASVHREVDDLVAKGRLDGDRANRLKASVTGSTSLEAFADADFVIEAVFEDLSVKRRVFADLEAVVSPECVLATNTSSLSVSAMAAGLAHPQRVVGCHFFNPVAVMPLLEVVAAEHTDEATLATAFATGKALKKTCILVRDCPSFVVNRLLGRLTSEVLRLVDEGTPIEVVDASFAGLAPMPPFVLFGLVGPAIALHNVASLHAAFPDRFTVSATLRRVVESGKPGFYLRSQGRLALDPEVTALVEQPPEPVVRTREEVRAQVLAALASEARLMLDEAVVSGPADIDLAMITGAGFFVFNGGLTPLLDRTGVAEQVTGRRFLRAGVASVPF